MNYFCCKQCGKLLELTPNNFHKKKDSKTGFTYFCKECLKEKLLNYEKVGELEKKCSKCNRILPNNEDYFFKRMKNSKALDSICKECKAKNFTEHLSITNGYKRCSKCSSIKQENQENFYRRPQNKFAPECKECRKKYENSKLEDRVRKYRNRLYNNPHKRAIANLRTRLRDFIKKECDSDSTIEIIGLTLEQFKEYIEKFMHFNMTWENYGKIWHIDHITPCSWFDKDKIKDSFKYTNLQPLFTTDNLRKSNTNNYRIIYKNSIIYNSEQYKQFENIKIYENNN